MQNEDSIFGDTRMVEYNSDRSQLALPEWTKYSTDG